MFLGIEYFRWFHRRKKVKFQMMSRNISSAVAKLLTGIRSFDSRSRCILAQYEGCASALGPKSKTTKRTSAQKLQSRDGWRLLRIDPSLA